MFVKMYTCLLMVYFVIILHSAKDREDYTFELIILAFIMWLPLVGRVMEFW